MLLSRVRLFVTPWTVAYQVSLSMGFSRQEYWSGLPFPSHILYGKREMFWFNGAFPKMYFINIS